MSSGHPQFRPSDDVVFRGMAGETVLINIRTNRIYSLNATGTRCWILLSEGQMQAEIVEQLALEFSVDPAEVEREVEVLIDQLRSEELLVPG